MNGSSKRLALAGMALLVALGIAACGANAQTAEGPGAIEEQTTADTARPVEASQVSETDVASVANVAPVEEEPPVSAESNRKGDEMLAPELTGLASWINSEPVTLESLRGKVVLVNFWTYACINCQRTLPYVKEWHRKYADEGLVILGIHTPEFGFEKVRDNVIQAVEDWGLEYAVAQDNDKKTWRAYMNRWWPAKYLIDKDGYIRDFHKGEGQYQQTEQKIRELLAEVPST